MVAVPDAVAAAQLQVKKSWQMTTSLSSELLNLMVKDIEFQ